MSNIKYSLVLGGEGFIGSHLVNSLVQKGCKVKSFDRFHSEAIQEKMIESKSFQSISGDFQLAKDLMPALEGCDVCYHLISTTTPLSSNLDPLFDIESNIKGTVQLLKLAMQAGVKKVVFISSGGTVYGVPQCTPILESHPTNPVCSYGITKLAIEKYLHLYASLHGLQYSILRVANPYGEGQKAVKGQGAIAAFLSKALRNEQIEVWGDGSVVRDYLHVDDVVSALLMAAEYAGDERVFNIGSGAGQSLNVILNSIEDMLGRPVRRSYLQARNFDVPSNVLCIDKAKQHLDWSPKVSFPEGLRRASVWLEKENISQNSSINHSV
jgi:UDP-glucose 4-epimerase